jgi:hypothetical protein
VTGAAGRPADGAGDPPVVGSGPGGTGRTGSSRHASRAARSVFAVLPPLLVHPSTGAHDGPDPDDAG